MKIRSGPEQFEVVFPEAPVGRLHVENRSAEIRRVSKRLRVLLLPHFESASRLGLFLGPDDIRAVIDGLVAETDGLSPEPALACVEELRAYVRRSMFDELVGEPSNVLYTTQVNADVVRYEAMPAEFWKNCLLALSEDLDRSEKNQTS